MSRLVGLGWLTALAACGASPDPAEGAPAEGLLTVRWRGSYEGSFSAPAVGRWCTSDSLVEILAVRGDTGVGLAMLGPDSVLPGQYPVYPPRVLVTSRPQAFAVARWLGREEVLGFEGGGGQVVLTEAGARLTGRIEASLKVYREASQDTLRLVGEFTRIAVRTVTPPCGRLLTPAGR